MFMLTLTPTLRHTLTLMLTVTPTPTLATRFRARAHARAQLSGASCGLPGKFLCVAIEALRVLKLLRVDFFASLLRGTGAFSKTFDIGDTFLRMQSPGSICGVLANKNGLLAQNMDVLEGERERERELSLSVSATASASVSASVA